MYQEEIADIFAAHLRSHMTAYLTFVNNLYNDNLVMVFPKSIETNNLVGGVYNAELEDMPAYAVDIISKTASPTQADLWIYGYEGHIAGVVSGSDEEQVNKLVKRHEQAAEMFIRNHQFMHQTQSEINDGFMFVEIQFVDAAFSGAEQVGADQDGEKWMAGFRIDITIIVSESGQGDHETPVEPDVPPDPFVWYDRGPASVWEADNNFAPNSYVQGTTEDSVWFSESGGLGGSVEPDWVNGGDQLTDGDVTWNRVPAWQANIEYSVPHVIQPTTSNQHTYEVLTFDDTFYGRPGMQAGRSGFIEPIWTIIGGTNIDPWDSFPVTWEDGGEHNQWQPNTVYPGFDFWSAEYQSFIVDPDGYTWSTTLGGTSGVIEPDWLAVSPGPVTDDGGVEWFRFDLWTPGRDVGDPTFGSFYMNTTGGNNHHYENTVQGWTGHTQPAFSTDGSDTLDPAP